ncbi:MAG: phasin family protein [Pseudomonadota bacterium]
MAKSSNPEIEMPEQIRDLTEKSLETAQQAFNDFISQTRNTMGEAADKTEEIQTNARDAQAQVMAFAEANVSAAMEFGRRMVGASSPEEIMNLQKQYAEAQMKALSTQSDAIADIAKSLTRTVGRE